MRGLSTSQVLSTRTVQGGSGYHWSFQIPDPTTKEDRGTRARARHVKMFPERLRPHHGHHEGAGGAHDKYTSHKLIAKVS